MIKITNKENCCGCSGCYNVCPVNAISMQADEEGFLYPIIDETKCIQCGLCLSVCPILNKSEFQDEINEAYIYQDKDDNVLNTSTSGGFIDSLFRYVLNSGGYVSGVEFDNNFKTKHIITNDFKSLSFLRGSKYSQSDLGNIFSQIKMLLQNDHLVAFCGTPCQVNGLKKVLKKDYNNLITVDIVCRSIPSPLFWQKYLEWQETKHKSKISYVNCRAKTYGYHNGSLVIQFSNGKKYSGSNRIDPYMKCFHSNVCSRPSCYNCKFKTRSRVSDFTVFDSWHPEKVSLKHIKDNNKGYSNIAIHTKKGLFIIQHLMQISPSSFSQAQYDKLFEYTGKMDIKSIKEPSNRIGFYKDLKTIGFFKTYKKYVKISFMDHLIEKIKPFYLKLKLCMAKVNPRRWRI